MKNQSLGTAQTDQAKPIDKAIVLSLIGEQIKKLEAHEVRILNGGIFEDDLLDTAENQAMADNFSLAAHATSYLEYFSLFFLTHLKHLLAFLF